MRKYTYYLLALVVVVAAVYALLAFLPSEVKAYLETRYIQVAIAIAVGVLAIEYLAKVIMQYAKKIGTEALLIRNVVLVIGYVVLAIVVVSVLGVGGVPLLASATFSGLIIGLGMQPVLANFFAGLIILTTGFLKPGKKVRIASASIP